MSNLLKLPFILTVVTSVSVATTAPFTARAEERFKGGNIMERKRILAVLPGVMKVAGWMLGGIEVAAILLDQRASSRHIAAMLAVKAKPTDFVLTPWSLFGCLLIVIGSWIRWRCYVELGSFFTYDLSIRENHRLVTSGPYSFVRHPSYSGGWLMLFGMHFWYGAPGSWVRESGMLDKTTGLLPFGLFVLANFTICVAAAIRTRSEDAMLRETFGEKWDQWSKKVPYALCPGIF